MILDPIATPDISGNDVFIVDSTIPIVNLLGGHPDDLRYFVFANDSVFESNLDIKLQGGVNFQGTVGDTLILLYDGTNWLEISRSLNPLYAGGELNDYTLDSGYILSEINMIKNQIAVMQHQLDKIGITESNLIVNFEPTMSRAVMQDLINNVNPTLINGVTVNFIFADGTYILDGPLEFRRFNGDGQIEISSLSYSDIATESLSVKLDSSFVHLPILQFFNCDISIKIAGIEGFSSNPLNPSLYNNAGFVVVNSPRINIHQCYVHSNNSNDIGVCYFNSSGIIKHTYTNNGLYGISATDMSKISICDCYSNNSILPQYGIASLKGSEITLWDNNSPSGSVDNAKTEDGGRINA